MQSTFTHASESAVFCEAYPQPLRTELPPSATQTPSPFLIPELLLLILGLSDKKALGRCLQVCKLWNGFAGELLYKDLEVTIKEFKGPIMRGLIASRRIWGSVGSRNLRPLFTSYTKHLTIDMSSVSTYPKPEVALLPFPHRIETLELRFDTLCTSSPSSPHYTETTSDLSTINSALTPRTLRIHGAPPVPEYHNDFSLLERAEEVIVVGDLEVMHNWAKILTDIDNAGITLPPMTFLIRDPTHTSAPAQTPRGSSGQYEMNALVEFLTAATPWNASIRQATIYLLEDITLMTRPECSADDLEMLLYNLDVRYTPGERRLLRLRSRTDYLAEERDDLSPRAIDRLRALQLEEKGGIVPRGNEVCLFGDWTIMRLVSAIVIGKGGS